MQEENKETEMYKKKMIFPLVIIVVSIVLQCLCFGDFIVNEKVINVRDMLKTKYKDETYPEMYNIGD